MAKTRALVIGGSLAGMFASRVLSDLFDKVTLIDRDSFPEGAADDRAGVPQGRHNHAVLTCALRELDRFFPDFEQALVKQGASDVDAGWDVAHLFPNGWGPRYRTPMKFIAASRPLIENTVRALCRNLGNLEFVQRSEVSGLAAARNGGLRCTGVKLRSRDGGANATIDADLVVDASGRSSRAPEWFRELGLTPPAETVVDPFVGYSSRWYRLKPERWPSGWWWKGGAFYHRFPQEPVVEALIWPKEHDRWHLTVAGFNRHYPPSNEKDLSAMLGTLQSPLIAEMTRLMEPDSPVYSYRAMQNRWRHYERWPERLDRFVALGDSVCAFNPVYGQGISTAAVAARLLGECITAYGLDSGKLARRFFAAQMRFDASAWLMSAGFDLSHPFTEGARTLKVRLFNRYVEWMGASDDPFVRDRFDEAMHLLRSPTSLYAPPTLSRVMRARMRTVIGNLAGRRAQAAFPPMPAFA